MAAPASRQRPVPSAARFEPDRLLPMWIVASLVLLFCALAALAMGVRWMNDADAAPDREAPNWLATETVRAVSGDGHAIKARVALDVPDSDTRALIRNRPHQVALAMQIGAAEYEVGDAEGAERVEGLSAEIETHLNKFLVAHRVPPVREVVIQDLVLSKP